MTLACDDSSLILLPHDYKSWNLAPQKKLMDNLGTFLFYRRGKLRPRERK